MAAPQESLDADVEVVTPGHNFGTKTIDTFGSWAFMINNITGPGMVTLPVLFQRAGWVLPTIVFITCAVSSSLSTLFLVEAMHSIPGNDLLQQRHEFVSVMKHYFGRVGYWMGQLFVNLTLQSMNVATIIVSGQVMDFALMRVFGATCGVSLFPPEVVCEDMVTTMGGATPFEGLMVMSAGLGVVMVLMLPLAFLNLDDNMWVQKASAAGLAVMLAVWVASFWMVGVNFQVSAFGDDLRNIVGTVLFNYTYVITVPSWINEKVPAVSARAVVWGSNAVSLVVFLAIGYFGAAAFRFTGTMDLLSAMAQSKSGSPFLSGLAMYSFPCICLIPSIPVFSIIVRYNLVASGAFGAGESGARLAQLIGGVLPWCLSVLFYTGAGLQTVMNWTSLLFGCFIDFVVPCMILVRAAEMVEERWRASSRGEAGGGPAEAAIPDKFRAIPSALLARLPPQFSATFWAKVCLILMSALSFIAIAQGTDDVASASTIKGFNPKYVNVK